MDVSDAAVERVSREFREPDRHEAETLILQYLDDEPRSAVPTWETVLDLAHGDLATLRSMVGSDADCDDFRDRWIARDRWRILAQLVLPRGYPMGYGCLGPDYAAEIQRLLVPHRERAARFFPPEQVGEALLLMGWSWPSNADDVLALAHGDVRRLRALFRARRTGEFDPMAPPALADLPLAAAELIHRDFSPDAWEAAATVAAGAPPMRGEGGVLAWLLAAEYARGDVADFSWAVRMLRENESELYSGVGRRRAERRRRGSNSERSPMSIESQDDLDGLRRAGRIVRICIERMKKAVRPGVTTAELDRIGGAALREYGARSAPKLVYNFPADMLISVNDEAVHGVPGPRRLRDGDLVKLDVTVEKDGYMADAAVTVPVGRVTEQRRRMIAAARAGFERAMKVAVAGYRVRDIGRAIETEVASRGFRVVREFQGHGIGRTIHEPPSVPSHFDARFTQQLTEGLVIAVEPIVTERSPRTVVGDDGWTVRTADGGFTAHYEHTIVVTRGRPILLTAA